MPIFSNTYSLRIVGQSIYDNENVYTEIAFSVKNCTKMDTFCAKSDFSMHGVHLVMLA